MFIRTHTQNDQQRNDRTMSRIQNTLNQRDPLDQIEENALKSNMRFTDLGQNIKQSKVLPDPITSTYDPLTGQNTTARDQFNDKLTKLDTIDQVQETVRNIQIELQRLREDTYQSQNQQKTALQQNFQQKVNDIGAKIDRILGSTNAVSVKTDALQSRETLRDNILQIHDQALTNFSKVVQRLESKISELEAQMIQKDELDQRIRNLEHDVQSLFGQMQSRFAEVSTETNGNVANIMGVLQLFEQKQKAIIMQIDQLRMVMQNKM
ncbi:Conserved_hypothetical protein [Hexamita inflata]|uniref:Uncharacterized protein n=1 Tax=Hexamita inflata TaxID=28002 RepID=A0AA86PYW7_9EUKA|nr:Conserved hypothetical protein [Hexamita inflata]